MITPNSIDKMAPCRLRVQTPGGPKYSLNLQLLFLPLI